MLCSKRHTLDLPKSWTLGMLLTKGIFRVKGHLAVCPKLYWEHFMCPQTVLGGGAIIPFAQVRNFKELICIVSLDQSRQQ